ncbi:MAG: DUF4838 domain-containing protein [Bacilli bacterium]
MFALSLILISCRKKKPEVEDKPPFVEKPIEESELKLVENGKTDYVIVYPKNAGKLITITAVEELQYFFGMATGITLEAIDDESLESYSSSKYISIGNTSLLKEANLEINYDELGFSGLKILLKNENLFLYGATNNGVLYSVYAFLQRQFDFEIYAADEIYIKRNVTDMNVLDFDLTDVPSFDYRINNYGEFSQNAAYGQRMRMHKFEELWIRTGTSSYHNFYSIVDPDIYEKEHPEWYSSGQLALMTDPEGISEVVVDVMKEKILEFPNADLLIFGQEDIPGWSSAPISKQLHSKYGTNSAELILFINIVAEKIENWLEEEHPDRNVTLVIFAYKPTEQAPAVWNEKQKKYVAIDEDVILRDNVAVMYAPINADHYYDYYHEQNVDVATTMQKWNAITNNLLIWSYSTYFNEYFLPFDSFNSIQGKYQYVLEYDAKYMFDQAQHNQAMATDWARLKQFLSSKLQWNSFLDLDTLVDDFFTNYFKDSKPAMSKYYKSYRVWHAHLANEFNVPGYVSSKVMKKAEYFPRGLLLEWLSYIDEAYDEIKHLESTEVATYKTLYNRITLESLSIRYLLIELYGIYYTEADLEIMINDFKRDVTLLGIPRIAELELISTYFLNK